MGACIALALPHLFMGLWSRRGAPLFFVLATLSVTAISAGELLLMRTIDVAAFGGILRWMQVPIFFLTIGLVGFVHSYLGGSRLWLGIAACGVRFLCVLINFTVQPNLNFEAFIGLRQVLFLGENVTVPIGVLSPWTHLSELASTLVLIFVVDSAIRAWPKSTVEKRQRLSLVCGSIAFFILVAALLTAVTHRQIIAIPYMVSFPFAAIVVAMAFELGADLFRANRVEEELEVSEASLEESEARFTRMADAAPVMIWMSGPDKLCTFFNKAWLEFTGREMSQELGHGWAEGVHTDDFEKCLQTYSGAFEQRQSFVMQYRLKDRNGRYRWVTDNGVPRYGRQGNFRGYIGACLDITDLLEKNRALRQIEERVTLAAEVAHLGIWELEPDNGHLWMSEKGRKLFGFDPQTALNYESLHHQVHPEDRSRWQRIASQAIKSKGSYEVEYRIQLPDGTTRWIHGRGQCVPAEDGGVTRLVGVSMDVTERKQAQQLFELAAEASPSGIVLVDADGQIVLTNAHVEELFGYRRDELVGKPLETLVPKRFASQDPFDRKQFLALAQTRPIRQGGVLCGLRKNGTEFPIEIGLSPIETPRGVLVLVSIVDLSARKLAEEEAQGRRDEIELLSRLSLLGEMTASIAHEVNQPLSGIISNASAGQRFIDRGDLDPERLRAILVDIVADGRRAHDVIRNIRNTVKKGGAIREPFDLNEVMRNVAHLMKPEADSHSCELETSLVRDLPKVEGDPVQIQQVLVNLISNAFDAMSNTPPAQRKVEVSARPNGNGTVCVSVRDHGTGIREETRAQLFQQFFTTKEDGLGMGLAIVRSIVEAHRGMIAVENAEDGGARFYFTLPIREEANS
jgi:PAS domain S-box-containing protein